jgi:tetrahydromethanopterin S-methyltransferase subunit F
MPRTSKTAGRGKSSKSTRVTTSKKLDSATARATRITAKVGKIRAQTEQLAETTTRIHSSVNTANQLAGIILGLVSITLIISILITVTQ